MTILARFQNTEVEVLSTFEGSGGRKLATVRALKGEPFSSWTHGGWCCSAFANLQADLLEDVKQDPQPKPNLLQLALAQARPQWESGESVWIWQDNGKGGAFLKSEGRHVTLNVTGYPRGLEVFWMNPAAGWEPCRNLETRYRSWASRAQEVLR